VSGTWGRWITAAILLGILGARAAFPDRVVLDWPAVVVLLTAGLVIWGPRLTGLLDLIDEVGYRQWTVKFRRQARRAARSLDELGAPSPDQTLKWPLPGLPLAPGKAPPGIPGSLFKFFPTEKAGRADGASLFGALDRPATVLWLGGEIEKELRSLWQQATPGQGAPNVVRPDLLAGQLAAAGVFGPALSEAITAFWKVRDHIAHGLPTGDDSALASAVHSARRLLALLRELPAPGKSEDAEGAEPTT